MPAYETLSLAERRAVREEPARQRAQAAASVAVAAALVAEDDYDGADAELMHAYHGGCSAVELMLAITARALGGQR